MATFKIKMPKCNECDCVINDGDGKWWCSKRRIFTCEACIDKDNYVPCDDKQCLSCIPADAFAKLFNARF